MSLYFDIFLHKLYPFDLLLLSYCHYYFYFTLIDYGLINYRYYVRTMHFSFVLFEITEWANKCVSVSICFLWLLRKALLLRFIYLVPLTMIKKIKWDDLLKLQKVSRLIPSGYHWNWPDSVDSSLLRNQITENFWKTPSDQLEGAKE